MEMPMIHIEKERQPHAESLDEYVGKIERLLKPLRSVDETILLGELVLELKDGGLWQAESQRYGRTFAAWSRSRLRLKGTDVSRLIGMAEIGNVILDHDLELPQIPSHLVALLSLRAYPDALAELWERERYNLDSHQLRDAAIVARDKITGVKPIAIVQVAQNFEAIEAEWAANEKSAGFTKYMKETYGISTSQFYKAKKIKKYVSAKEWEQFKNGELSAVSLLDKYEIENDNRRNQSTTAKLKLTQRAYMEYITRQAWPELNVKQAELLLAEAEDLTLAMPGFIEELRFRAQRPSATNIGKGIKK